MMYQFFDLVELWQSNPEWIKSMLTELLTMLGDKTIEPLNVTVFPLAKSEDAFRFMARAMHIGKVVIKHPAPVEPVALSAEGCYLVTGGYGGIGLQTAMWLVKKGARNICVLSRRAAAPESALKALRTEASDVRLIAAQGDVAVLADVRGAIQKILTLGLTLRGVVHSAGLTNDKATMESSWEDFQGVLGVKVQGALNLHTETLGMQLDLFVLYSSTSGMLGNMGQASYAAANAYLDGLCHYHHSLGLPALAVIWGPWADVRMAAAMKNAAALGLTKEKTIPPSTGIHLLELTLMEQQPHFAIFPAVSCRWRPDPPR